MLRHFLPILILLGATAAAKAHFVFVVPDPGASTARVILSETLEPDADVGLAGGARLSLRSADGRNVPLELTRDGDVFTIKSPETGTRVVHGVADFGVVERGKGAPHRLVYHPKTIIGDAFDARAVLGDGVPVELVPVGGGGAVRIELRVAGKPRADAEVTVIHPDGREERVKTDAAGRTPGFKAPGRYGAWARDWRDSAGETGGKRYEQVRNYATLVFDFGAPGGAPAKPSAAAPAAGAARTAAATVEPYTTKLPEATSSFGAVAVDGWLYVYGGHISPTHNYSTEAVSGRFSRLNLSDGRTWEELPGGTGLQGLNLATHGGRVIRVGGMRPLNAPGEPADNWSVVDCAGYDPATGAWEALPPLPAPRSSHDAIVVGDTLVVMGGWNLRGKQEPTWYDTILTLDLSAAEPKWESAPQPFRRRALVAAVHDGKVFVLGGFDDQDRPSRRVDVYDPKTGEWSLAPGLPGVQKNGFAPAACVHDRSLYVSVGDGTLHRLDGRENVWETVATTTPRIVHRIVPVGPSILVAGGASGGANFDLVESVGVGRAAARANASTPPTVKRGATTRPVPPVAGTASAATGQTFCPVMPDERVDSESIVVDYRGKQVRLCCRKCLKAWNAGPEKYVDPVILPQLAETVAR